jgi:hypothetical protein
LQRRKATGWLMQRPQRQRQRLVVLAATATDRPQQATPADRRGEKRAVRAWYKKQRGLWREDVDAPMKK